MKKAFHRLEGSFIVAKCKVFYPKRAVRR